MSQWGFYFDQTRCIGCYTCSVACKDWHDLPASIVNWRKVELIEYGKFPNPFVAYLSISCNHCENPPCLNACPVNAIIKRPSDGIVIVNQDKCIGKTKCGFRCLKACPWDSPQFRMDDDAKMEKCNLCVERLEQGKNPICVDACPMHALDAGSLEELQEKYGKEFKAEGFVYSEKIKPSILFKPKQRP